MAIGCLFIALSMSGCIAEMSPNPFGSITAGPGEQQDFQVSVYRQGYVDIAWTITDSNGNELSEGQDFFTDSQEDGIFTLYTCSFAAPELVETYTVKVKDTYNLFSNSPTQINSQVVTWEVNVQ